MYDIQWKKKPKQSFGVVRRSFFFSGKKFRYSYVIHGNVSTSGRKLFRFERCARRDDDGFRRAHANGADRTKTRRRYETISKMQISTPYYNESDGLTGLIVQLDLTSSQTWRTEERPCAVCLRRRRAVNTPGVRPNGRIASKIPFINDQILYKKNDLFAHRLYYLCWFSPENTYRFGRHDQVNRFVTISGGFPEKITSTYVETYLLAGFTTFVLIDNLFYSPFEAVFVFFIEIPKKSRNRFFLLPFF